MQSLLKKQKEITPLMHRICPAAWLPGGTIAEVEFEMREAIAFHVEGLREDGLPVPAGASQVEYIEVSV
jgi:predicted RNase H-like HicB family nuclease